MNKPLRQRTLEVQWGHQLEARPIDWLWEPWLARGVVVVIDGDPGMGKSSLTMDLVARVTTGKPFPNVECGIRNAESKTTEPHAQPPAGEAPISIPHSALRIPHSGAESKTAEPHAQLPHAETTSSIPHSALCIPHFCLVVPMEDPIDKVVLPRLHTAGADVSKVAFLGNVKESGPDDQSLAQLQLPRDLGLIRAQCAELRPAMLVIDPLFAVLGYDEEGRYIKASDDQSVRRLTARLKHLAEELDITIVLVRHLNKASGGTAIKRGSGSIAIGGQARAVMLVGRDPNQPDDRVLAMIKNNFAPTPRSLRFQVAGQGASSRIDWLGDCDLVADDLLGRAASRGDRESALECAEHFLRHTLGHEKASWPELVRLAKEEQISEQTLRRARAKLKLKLIRAGESKCLWELPPAEKLQLLL